MSLILEALRKLEREKQLPARGVVVVGTAAIGAEKRRPLALFVLGLVLGSVVLAGVLGRRPAPRDEAARPAPPRPAATATPRADESPAGARSAKPELPAAAATGIAASLPAAKTPPRAVAAPAVLPSVAPTATPAPTFALQAISERDGHAVALINDRLLREGDSLEGARLVRIGRDEVELEIAGRRVRLGF